MTDAATAGALAKGQGTARTVGRRRAGLAGVARGVAGLAAVAGVLVGALLPGRRIAGARAKSSQRCHGEPRYDQDLTHPRRLSLRAGHGTAARPQTPDHAIHPRHPRHDRLSLSEDGRVLVGLRRPWPTASGVGVLSFEPVAFLGSQPPIVGTFSLGEPGRPAGPAALDRDHRRDRRLRLAGRPTTTA